VVAESKTIAEEITGKTCVAYTDAPSEGVEIGGTYANKKFTRRKPYPSWVTDGKSGWQAPIDYPAFDLENPKYYDWDESTTSWVEITA